jgi:hypothetical protein
MRPTLLALLLTLGCKSNKADDPEARDIAQLTVKKLAFEAYPQWAARHVEQACPAKLDELMEFMGPDVSTKDAWGHEFQIGCGPTAPKGARGLAAWSLGPDGKDGTADDIKSW